MFHGNDPDGKGYSTRAHLAEVIGLLGPPPVDLLRRGKRSWEFFTEDGMWMRVEMLSIGTDRSEQGNGSRMLRLLTIRRWKHQRRSLKGGIRRCSWLSWEGCSSGVQKIERRPRSYFRIHG